MSYHIFFIKLVLPHAVNIIILIQEHLTVHSLQFFRCIHIEDKATAGIQHPIDSANRLFAIFRICNVIHTVQSAHSQVNTSRQRQLLQLLTNKHGRILQFLRLLCSNAEHFLRHIHSRHLHAMLRQKHGYRASSTGQVHSGTGCKPLII